MNLQWRWAALKNGLQDATAYRIEFLFEILGSALVPAAIQIMLWYALFKIGGATEVAGMSYASMIQYTLISVLFSQIRGGDLDFEIMEMIRSGSLSQYILRPVSVLEFIYIRGLAPKLFLAAICFVVGCLIGWFYGMSPIRLFIAMLLAILGNIIHFQISCALATVAFYWEEAYSILMVKNLLVSFLSGELIPLYLFSQNTEWIWKSLPFYIYVFGPVQIANGTWGWVEVAHHFGIAILWCLAGWGLLRFFWNKGIKNYQSIGG